MRILLVEDDRDVARFVSKGLKENLFLVDLAKDGEEGFELITQEKYDLIILDILLPKMDGWQVLQKIKEKGIETPVIILTARDSTPDVVKGLNLGADDYLIKPFSFSELLARMRAILRRGKIQRPTELKVANLVLNQMTREVYRDTVRIDLTSKEYALLEYFMQNTGLILTRTMLLEAVWDYNFDPMTNVIDVHINHLRNKIDRDFTPKLLHTIKGVGYVLKAKD
ncbi:MAG TPA: heavy metal response regulator transcription factor [Thermodesulfobacteriota bacterium]|jgi:heavy metal response regulator|nr:heavy metal response regulator transcription factor [Thermodesulfobacteriota bacterium]